VKFLEVNENHFYTFSEHENLKFQREQREQMLPRVL